MNCVCFFRYLTKLWNERKEEKKNLTHLPQWEQDHFLSETQTTMFWEYLEVGMYVLANNM